MTLEVFIMMLVGGILSILQELIDGWLPWYGNLKPLYKRLITIGLMIVAGAIIYGLACAGLLQFIAPDISVACTEQGLVYLLQVIFLLAIGSQTTHLLIKRS